MRPKTLLEMAGAPATPSRLSDAAVVVIDAQREYVDGKLPLAGMQQALSEIARLIKRARNAGAPVVHIVHEGKAGGAFDRGGPGGQIADPAAPLPGELVIGKRLPNAFAGTDLAERLKGLDRREIILVGFMTHMCVEATARSAVDHGLKATVIAAATATRDLPDPTGSGTIAASEVQRNALAAMADRFAAVVPSVEAFESE